MHQFWRRRRLPHNRRILSEPGVVAVSKSKSDSWFSVCVWSSGFGIHQNRTNSFGNKMKWMKKGLKYARKVSRNAIECDISHRHYYVNRIYCRNREETNPFHCHCTVFDRRIIVDLLRQLGVFTHIQLLKYLARQIRFNLSSNFVYSLFLQIA